MQRKNLNKINFRVNRLKYFRIRFQFRRDFRFFKETSRCASQRVVKYCTYFKSFQKNSKNTNLYTKIFTPFYERTSWVQIMKFNKGRKSRDTLPLMKCLSQVLVGSHLMGRMDHYLIADQSGADPHRVELAKQRSTYCMYQILKNKHTKKRGTESKIFPL